MIVEFRNASRLNDMRATPSLWLTDRPSIRALKGEVSVFMMPPSSQRRRRHIGRVSIQISRSIPRVPSNTARLCSGRGKLRFQTA